MYFLQYIIFQLNTEGGLLFVCWNPRCETEEITTLRLEQQVAVLRESKRKADQSSTILQADLRHSMADLQEMHLEFEVTKCADIFFPSKSPLSLSF